MKRFIWKVRYASRIRKRSRMPWPFCWESACIAIQENPDWEDDGPIYSADEELACWSD